jgi:hypothetical protein
MENLYKTDQCETAQSQRPLGRPENMLAYAVKLPFPLCEIGIPANVLAHSIKQPVLTEIVRQASEHAGTSVLQPHSRGQLGMPPNILAVL